MLQVGLLLLVVCWKTSLHFNIKCRGECQLFKGFVCFFRPLEWGETLLTFDIFFIKIWFCQLLLLCITVIWIYRLFGWTMVIVQSDFTTSKNASFIFSFSQAVLLRCIPGIYGIIYVIPHHLLYIGKCLTTQNSKRGNTRRLHLTYLQGWTSGLNSDTYVCWNRGQHMCSQSKTFKA